MITVRLLPVAVPAGTFVEWSCDYDVVTGDEQGLVDYIVGQVYEPCFAGLRELLTGRTARQPVPA